MQVRITRRGKSAMQSAVLYPHNWVIEPVREAHRESNPLTGWTSAPDALTTLCGRLRFDTAAQAAAFAKVRGWSFTIEDTNARTIRPRSYVDNFNPDRRRSGR